MAIIYFVRHGKAAAGWGEHPDPGLDATGQAQAQAVATLLQPLGPLAVLSSPLARARETAAPLLAHWGSQARIEPRVAEIPSPGSDLVGRGSWLSTAMAGTWEDLGEPWLSWRDTVASALLAQQEDTVIFSHFVAINAAVSMATGDPRLLCFRPDNASVTRFDTGSGQLQLLELGREAVTKVN